MEAMGELETQVNEALADAAVAHPWLQSAMSGRGFGANEVDVEEFIAGLIAAVGSLIDCVNLIARTIDRQDASR